MFTVLIVSNDSDIAGVLSLILNRSGYEAVHVGTVAELLQNLVAVDFIILDRPFNLSPNDWDVLKKQKEEDGGKLPIAITNSPQTIWLQQKSKEVGIDMIFPYPCDLTVELPAFFEAYFGS